MDGSVWVGTFGGLNQWKNGQLTVYTKNDGLPDDSVESLFQDDHGRIWVATGRGVVYFENGRFVAVETAPYPRFRNAASISTSADRQPAMVALERRKPCWAPCVITSSMLGPGMAEITKTVATYSHQVCRLMMTVLQRGANERLCISFNSGSDPKTRLVRLMYYAVP